LFRLVFGNWLIADERRSLLRRRVGLRLYARRGNKTAPLDGLIECGNHYSRSRNVPPAHRFIGWNSAAILLMYADIDAASAASVVSP
jgi:hypothetical protein